MSHICDTDILRNLDFKIPFNFESLEIVDRGSETQLQVTQNLNSWLRDLCVKHFQIKDVHHKRNMLA